VPKEGEGKSLTTSRLEKAGVAAHTQQPGAGKPVKVAVGGKLHRRGGKTHFPNEMKINTQARESGCSVTCPSVLGKGKACSSGSHTGEL
jgi:hypothetical protein